MKSIRNFLLAIRHPKLYLAWKKRMSGEKVVDYKRGIGYYLQMCYAYNPIGMQWKTEMASGKIGIYELIDFQQYDDPPDMTKESYWQFIGYEGMPRIKELTFEGYLRYYTNVNI